MRVRVGRVWGGMRGGYSITVAGDADRWDEKSQRRCCCYAGTGGIAAAVLCCCDDGEEEGDAAVVKEKDVGPFVRSDAAAIDNYYSPYGLKIYKRRRCRRCADRCIED